MTTLLKATNNKNAEYIALPNVNYTQVFRNVTWIDWMLQFSVKNE